MSNKLGQSPPDTRIPLSAALGVRQRQILCPQTSIDKTPSPFCNPSPHTRLDRFSSSSFSCDSFNWEVGSVCVEGAGML